MALTYERARRRLTDGRWTWSNALEGRVWPVGYCAGWREFTPAQLARMTREYGPTIVASLLERRQRDGPFKAKFHTDGHATQDAAERCHYEYSYDHMARFAVAADGAEYACQAAGCAEPATGGLGTYGTEFPLTLLCAGHCQPATMRDLYPFRPGRIGIAEGRGEASGLP